MTTPADLRSRRFGVLSRLNELRLEEARVEREIIDAAVERQRVEVRRIEAVLADSHAFAGELVGRAGGVTAEALHQLHLYARWQAGLLAEEQAVLDLGQAQAEVARQHVVQRFEELSVVERYHERRVTEHAVEVARNSQHVIDDQAPVRAVASPGGRSLPIYKETEL